MIPFSDTQPKIEEEEDRYPLKPGDTFVLTGYVIQPSRKYSRGVAKINGFKSDAISNGIAVKYRTTGIAIISQLTNIAESVGIDAGKFKDEIPVTVVEIQGENGTYFSFTDPEEG